MLLIVYSFPPRIAASTSSISLGMFSVILRYPSSVTKMLSSILIPIPWYLVCSTGMSKAELKRKSEWNLLRIHMRTFGDVQSRLDGNQVTRLQFLADGVTTCVVYIHSEIMSDRMRIKTEVILFISQRDLQYFK